MKVAYKRILLKLSGEALAGNDKTGINIEHSSYMCRFIVISDHSQKDFIKYRLS